MKILKWFLVSIGTVILLGGSYILYEFKFKTYDVADPEVDQIIDEGYEIELPDGTSMKIAGDGTIREGKNTANAEGQEDPAKEKQDEEVPEASAAVKDPVKEPVKEPVKDSSTAAKQPEKEEAAITKEPVPAKPTKPQTTNPPAAKPVTAESIKEKYRGALVSLQQQAEVRVDHLVDAAKQEYVQKKANGEKISAGYFYAKYMGSSDSLESSTDGAFENLMKVVEADLTANGFKKSEAQSFRDEYNQTKEDLRSSLMKKALAELK